MLFITLTSQKASDFTIDGQRIDWVGVRFGYNPDDAAMRDELVAHNRGIWRLGKRARGEGYIAFVFQSRVLCLAGIDAIKTHESGRSYFVCHPLSPGNAAYDKWIGQPSPALRSRNPLAYWSDPDLDTAGGWSWREDGDAIAMLNDLAGRKGTKNAFITALASLNDGNPA